MASRKKSNPRIPKGKDGYVPVEALQARHDSRSTAAKLVDENKDAQKIYPQTLTPSEAQSWWKHPGRSDITGIDTKAPANTVPKSSRNPPKGSNGSSKGTAKAGKSSKRSKDKLSKPVKASSPPKKPSKTNDTKKTPPKAPEVPKPSKKAQESPLTEEALRKKGYDVDVETSEGPGMRMIVISPKRPAPTYSNAPSGFQGPLMSAEEILAMFAEPVQIYDVVRGRMMAMSITREGGMFSTHGAFLPFPNGRITASPSAFVCDGKYIGITDNGQSYWFWIKSEPRKTEVKVAKPRSKAESPKVGKSKKESSSLESIQEPDDFKDIDKKKHRRRNRRRTPTTEYSASYYQRLPWKDDPERATSEAIEAMMSEGEEIEDARAYLKDSDYGEVASNDRWKYDSKEINKTYRRLQWDRFKMENPEYACNEKPARRWFRRGSKRRTRRGRR